MKDKRVTIASVLLLIGLAMGCSSQPKTEVVSLETPATKSTTTPAASKPEAKTAESVSQVKSPTVSFYTDNGVAIKGADPVAYFQEGKPVKGNSQFAYQWMNATWYFSIAQNRDLFVKNPQKYAPQYGGFCAWAVSRGYTAQIDPDAWKIVDGKLYLNYNRGVQRSWERDIPGNISRGDRNWPSLNDRLKK
jgi:YHS domain-containing protein